MKMAPPSWALLWRKQNWLPLIVTRRGTCIDKTLKRHSPHGAASWRLDDDACGPESTKTFLADLYNTVEKRCHYHWLFLTRVRAHDEISHLCFRVEEACASAGAPMSAMIAILVAVLASFRVTSRPCRDQHDLLWRGFESVVARIFPLPWLDRRQPGMTMDFVPFRSRVGAMRRPVGQRRPRFATVTL